jgi:hypothetical protein
VRQVLVGAFCFVPRFSSKIVEPTAVCIAITIVVLRLKIPRLAQNAEVHGAFRVHSECMTIDAVAYSLACFTKNGGVF